MSVFVRMFLCFLSLLRSSISEFPCFLPVTPSITTQTYPFSQLRFIACRCLALTLHHCTESHKHIKSRSSIIEVTERSSAVANSVQHNIKVCRVFFFVCTLNGGVDGSGLAVTLEQTFPSVTQPPGFTRTIREQVII